MAAWISGDAIPAQAAAGVLEDALAGPMIHPYRITVARLGKALLAVQQGDLGVVRDQYQALKSAPSIMLLLMSIDRVRGLLAAAIGEQAQAIAHFEDGLAFTRRAGYRPEMAWICCEYADVLLKEFGPGDWPKVETLLEESLVIANDLGMRPLIQRIEACRERLEFQPNDVPVYPAGLTQREVEV